MNGFLRPLSLLESRVLGVLLEKERTVPDSYPLSLNTLTLGCNQKSARDPVLDASEAEVQAAVDALKALALVFESSGSRVMRYTHNLPRVLRVGEPHAALLALLMLRGPQTAGELRINAERLHKFTDIAAVDAHLEHLAARPNDQGGPLVQRLAPGPRGREPRWAHLLCGPVDAGAATAAPAADADASHDGAASIAASEVAHLKQRIGALESQVAALQASVQQLCTSLGVEPPKA
ncbi:MAG: YceH family protein [Betaproteobacteria bacterium]|nr:YceH family protein [Betaproteobacteria bacterium]